MTLEEQYPSPERCEKLKELGWPQKYSNLWYTLEEPRGESVWPWSITCTWHKGDLVCPSVPEMLGVMPKFIGTHHEEYDLIVKYSMGRDEFCVMYQDQYSDKVLSDSLQLNTSLANAVADCLIWLIENKFISFTNKNNG